MDFYYSALIDQCAGDSMKFFDLVKFLCNDHNVSTLPAHDNPVLLGYLITLENFLQKKLNLLRIPSMLFNLILLMPILLIYP